jgi:hypothetical protein
MRRVLCLLLLCLAAANPTRPSQAHEFHVSLAEMEWNAEFGNFEVAIRLAPEDLEHALATRTGQALRLSSTAGVDSLLADYVADHFVITGPDGPARAPVWVGKEVSSRAAWLYLEYPAPELRGLRLRNTLLFELDETQVNTVNIRAGESRFSLVFTRNTPVQALADTTAAPR